MILVFSRRSFGASRRFRREIVGLDWRGVAAIDRFCFDEPKGRVLLLPRDVALWRAALAGRSAYIPMADGGEIRARLHWRGDHAELALARYRDGVLNSSVWRLTGAELNGLSRALDWLEQHRRAMRRADSTRRST